MGRGFRRTAGESSFRGRSGRREFFFCGPMPGQAIIIEAQNFKEKAPANGRAGLVNAPRRDCRASTSPTRPLPGMDVWPVHDDFRIRMCRNMPPPPPPSAPAACQVGPPNPKRTLASFNSPSATARIRTRLHSMSSKSEATMISRPAGRAGLTNLG